LAAGGDTKYVLMTNLVGTYALGLPLAIYLGLSTNLGLFGVFFANGAEEIIKLVCFFFATRLQPGTKNPFPYKTFKFNWRV
jgi:Na+-driven multidrug efflux pump